MSDKVYVFKRKQFSFKVDDRQLVCLTNKMVSNKSNVKINIAAIFTQKNQKTHENYVKLIVGNADPRLIAFNKEQECQFKKILKSLYIYYNTEKVLEILNANLTSGSPGLYRINITRLFCKKIPLISSYFGEYIKFMNTNIVPIFIEVPSELLNKAKDFIECLDLSDGEHELCINRFNVDKKCKKCTCDSEKKCSCN